MGYGRRTSSKGIRTLIGKDHASQLYGHPLVSSLVKEEKLPLYIGSGTCASVLADLFARDENGKSVVAGNGKASALVVDATMVVHRIDEGMNHVSGWYQRQARLL